MLALGTLAASRSAATHLLSHASITRMLITVVLFGAAFLFLLNLSLAMVFRHRRARAIEIFSYLASGVVELVIFIFVLLLSIGILTHVPFNLPPGLPVNRAELGGTLALAIGLFPAAYWHRMSLSQLRQRMADDAKVIKNREGGVRIRSNAPGEWLN